MRKLLSFVVDHTLWNVSNYIMRRRFDIACSKARDDLPVLFPRVGAMLDAQRKEGGFGHIFSEYKLLELAHFLWRFRPKVVLELGGGSTTSVMAEYAAAFPEVLIVSVDEDGSYLKATQARLAEELRNRVNFLHCPRREDTDDNGNRTCFYDSNWQELVPSKVIDLVYVDGPTADDGLGGKLPCTDVVRLKRNGWNIGHVLFDFRIASVKYCVASHLFSHHKFHLHRNALSLKDEPWVVSEIHHHSWLQPEEHYPNRQRTS